MVLWGHDDSFLASSHEERLFVVFGCRWNQVGLRGDLVGGGGGGASLRDVKLHVELSRKYGDERRS